MVLDDSITDGQAEPGSFADVLRCEERIEYLFEMLRLDSEAIVGDFDVDIFPPPSRCEW